MENEDKLMLKRMLRIGLEEKDNLILENLNLKSKIVHMETNYQNL